jgi:hypothetical protein
MGVGYGGGGGCQVRRVCWPGGGRPISSLPRINGLRRTCEHIHLQRMTVLTSAIVFH